MKNEQDIADLPLAVRAEMALKEAVAKVIKEHRLSGGPLVIWRDGRIVLLPTDQAGVEPTSPHSSAS